MAASISLHGAAAWFATGPAFPGRDSTLRTNIVAPFAETPATPLRTAAHVESKPLPASNSRDLRRGFTVVETIDPTYYAAEELDVFPAPLRPIGPLGKHATGYVRLLTRIDASGRVTATRIFDSSGTDGEDNTAMAAIGRTIFSAARKNGRKVRSEVVIELQ
jgi:TonB family protein